MHDLVCGPLPRMHWQTGTGVHRAFTKAATGGPSIGDVGKRMECQEVQTAHLLIWNDLTLYCSATSMRWKNKVQAHFFVGTGGNAYTCSSGKIQKPDPSGHLWGSLVVRGEGTDLSLKTNF